MVSSIDLIRHRQHALEAVQQGEAQLVPLNYDTHVSRMAEVQDLAIIACIEPRLSLVNLGHQFGKAVVGRIPGAYIGPHKANTAEAATVAIALAKGVSDIVVMGHSDCGAMTCYCKGHDHKDNENMGDVLGFLAPVQKWLKDAMSFSTPDAQHRSMAELTVMESVANLENYPGVQERMQAGTLHIHGMLLDLERARANPPQPFLFELTDREHGKFDRVADLPLKPEVMGGVGDVVGGGLTVIPAKAGISVATG